MTSTNELSAIFIKLNFCVMSFDIPVETYLFFAYVLLKCGTLAASHLLYLCVAVPDKGMGICPTTAQGVGIDAVGWDSFYFQVVEWSASAATFRVWVCVLCSYFVFQGGVQEISQKGGCLWCTVFSKV